MNRRVLALVALTAALWPVLVQAGQPQFIFSLSDRTVREQDLLYVSVVAVDGALPLAYDWTMEAGTTGAYFKWRAANAAQLAFPWVSSSAAGQLNGQSVTVKVVKWASPEISLLVTSIRP